MKWRCSCALAAVLPAAVTAFQSPVHARISPTSVHRSVNSLLPGGPGRASHRTSHRRDGVSSIIMQQDPARPSLTSTSAAASFNLAKAIVGAGSFSLPYVCKNEGVAGGVITIIACAILASFTMQSIIESKNEVELRTGQTGLSYVDTARLALGDGGARVVFVLTAMAALLVCASYLAFIGSTLGSMAMQDGNILHSLLPDSTTFRKVGLLSANLSRFLRNSPLLLTFEHHTPSIKLGFRSWRPGDFAADHMAS